ncbi:DUF2771 domain-containing protein [Nocardia sp. NPDC050712]|uniref:DUF2771 domain-containing protein n=1 Tax=Nocardia sp. NPDC050712 TaxID=3155518 RepID=UPI0033CD54D5
MSERRKHSGTAAAGAFSGGGVGKPSGRTIIALLAAAALVVGVAFVGVLIVTVRNADKHAPELTAYSHGKTVDVTPFAYCAVSMQNCRVLPQNAEDAVGTVFEGLPCEAEGCAKGGTADLQVPPGYPLQLSLPKQIVEAPWLAQLVYATEDGQRVGKVISRNDYPKDARAITIDSRPLPELRLIGVEMQLPILARDETGREFYVPHAAWSINTI